MEFARFANLRVRRAGCVRVEPRAASVRWPNAREKGLGHVRSPTPAVRRRRRSDLRPRSRPERVAPCDAAQQRDRRPRRAEPSEVADDPVVSPTSPPPPCRASSSITSTGVVAENDDSAEPGRRSVRVLLRPEDGRGNPRASRGSGVQVAAGSGFVISDTGWVLTNNHVDLRSDQDPGDVDRPRGLRPRSSSDADPAIDVALLKIDARKKLPALALGDSDKIARRRARHGDRQPASIRGNGDGRRALRQGTRAGSRTIRRPRRCRTSSRPTRRSTSAIPAVR